MHKLINQYANKKGVKVVFYLVIIAAILMFGKKIYDKIFAGESAEDKKKREDANKAISQIVVNDHDVAPDPDNSLQQIADIIAGELDSHIWIDYDVIYEGLAPLNAAETLTVFKDFGAKKYAPYFWSTPEFLDMVQYFHRVASPSQFERFDLLFSKANLPT